MCGWRLTEDQSLNIVFTRQEARTGDNPESPQRIKHGIKIREVPTTSRKVFTTEQNELFIQRVVQDAQGLEGEVLYYHILGLNESATENDLKSWAHYSTDLVSDQRLQKKVDVYSQLTDTY